MLTYLSADWVYPVVSPPLAHGVIGVTPDGTIKEILTSQEASDKNIPDLIHYKGILVPGFVNTHCHLELSHLKGKIAQHTGLPEFVEQVIRQRNLSEAEVVQAMTTADEDMYRSGIAAVGDISNQLISREVKITSKITYHTFIEVLGFNPSRAAFILEAALKLQKDFYPLKASVVPHAPYSVSSELFTELANYALTHENLGSIHNQETEEETLFFKDKTGAFLKLYQFLGVDISFFKPSGQSSLQTVLPLLSPQKTLLVHNTVSSIADVGFAEAMHQDLYWCLCPNANLYIENRLPNIKMLMKAGVKLTLGTDSLASNHSLNILNEMKTLQEQEKMEFSDLLTWATYNGAKFLGIANQFGSLEVDKRPGINLIHALKEGLWIEDSSVTRLY
jgi:cytosine/adenosine deaminase-related metal-dependent hydrolase